MYDDERTCFGPRLLVSIHGSDEAYVPQQSSFKTMWSHAIGLGTIIIVSYGSFVTIILAFLFFEGWFQAIHP